jgi:apolipoprotein N-acyltransferase
MKHLAFAFLAGLISALGFAPLHLWPLTILAFAGLLWLIEAAPALRSALARGWWFGVGQFVVGLNWIATAFTYQAAMPAWLGWVAVVLLSLYLALFPAAAAGLAWRWQSRPFRYVLRYDSDENRRFRLMLLLAAAWIVTEWLRGTLFTGFAWNPIGVIWVGVGGADDLSVYIGTYGLGGLTILAGGALFMLARKHWLQGAMVALLIILFIVEPPGPAVDERSQPALRIVQPDIGQANKWDPGYERENFERLARLTGPPGPAPRLILWPEAATPDFLSFEPRARQRLAGLLGPGDLLVLGGVEPVFGPDGHAIAAYNSVYALGPDARLRGRYDKAHLVPYGEYLPMRPLLSAIGLSRLAPGDLDFRDGPGPRTLDFGVFGRAGLQVCYEIIFSGRVIDRADRPDFIFNPSNDAWFGAWGPPQHLAQARLRAIEEGLPVIRATPTGISAVIDAQGRLLASLPLGNAGAIDARLPRAGAPTPFALCGNLLPLGLALLLVAAAVAVRRKSR